jgi:hypothetical protein
MSMKYLLSVCGIAAAAFALAAAPGAAAQENDFAASCLFFGSHAAELLGDRPGHAIAVGQYSCRIDSGPLTDGVFSGTNIVEWDKANGVLISGAGILRKPGSMAAYQLTDERFVLTMTGGNATGLTATGRGRWALASGGAASFAGRSFTFTVKTTGPDAFTVEEKAE